MYWIMDEPAKQIFKMKFAKLTMVLNGIFLLAALAILAAFGVIPIYSYPIAAICGAGAILLALYFRSAYRKDKEWLMAQDSEKGTQSERSEQSEQSESATGSDAGVAVDADTVANATNATGSGKTGTSEGESDA